jgi:hypothetical protein
MKPSDLRRAQNSLNAREARLAQEQAALDRARLELERARADLALRSRAATHERELAIVVLRSLCERYGTNDWSDETSLLEILEQHLASPLEAQLARVSRRMRSMQAALDRIERQPAPPDERAAPLPAPPKDHHSILIVLSQARGRSEVGQRASCTCGWRSPICLSREQARQLGLEHVKQPTRRRA